MTPHIPHPSRAAFEPRPLLRHKDHVRPALWESTLPTRYRCSICRSLVKIDGMKKHTDFERGQADWPGVITWERYQ